MYAYKCNTYTQYLFVYIYVAKTDKDQKTANEENGCNSSLHLQSSELRRMPKTNIIILYNYFILCLNEESFPLFKCLKLFKTGTL